MLNKCHLNKKQHFFVFVCIYLSDTNLKRIFVKIDKNYESISRRLQKMLKTQTYLSLFDCMLSLYVNVKKLIFFLVIAVLVSN